MGRSWAKTGKLKTATVRRRENFEIPEIISVFFDQLGAATFFFNMFRCASGAYHLLQMTGQRPNMERADRTWELCELLFRFSKNEM
jgi:hypothetical protein